MPVLISGVDTLVLTYLAPVDHETIARLGKAKDEARAKREAGTSEPTVVQLAGQEWIMQPQSAPPYRFLLHRPDEMDVRIAGRPTLAPNTPTVVAELRSEFLWRGWAKAARAAQDVAEAALGSPRGCLEAVARIDLCADFQGWQPDGTDDELRRFVRRIRKGVHRHGADDTFTGYSLGLGLPFQARLYDKTEEIKGTGKTWFQTDPALWLSSPHYDVRQPVWRLELQARTETLDEMGLRVDFARNVAGRLDELWRYAFGHPDWHPQRETSASVALRAARAAARKGRADAALIASLEIEVADEQRRQGAWISLRDPTSDTRTEWPIAPEWRELQRVVFSDADAVRACRVRQREAQIENLRQQIQGTLASLAALAGVRTYGYEQGRRWRNVRALQDALTEFRDRQLRADMEDPAGRDFAVRLDEHTRAIDDVCGWSPTVRDLPVPAPWMGGRDERALKDLPWGPADPLLGPSPLGDRTLLWNRAHANYRPARLAAGAEQTTLELPDHRVASALDRDELQRLERETRRARRFHRAPKWSGLG